MTAIFIIAKDRILQFGLVAFSAENRAFSDESKARDTALYGLVLSSSLANRLAKKSKRYAPRIVELLDENSWRWFDQRISNVSCVTMLTI